jgi:hypothetical protein
MYISVGRCAMLGYVIRRGMCPALSLSLVVGRSSTHAGITHTRTDWFVWYVEV